MPSHTQHAAQFFTENERMHPVSQLHLPLNPQHHQNAAYLALSTYTAHATCLVICTWHAAGAVQVVNAGKHRQDDAVS